MGTYRLPSTSSRVTSSFESHTERNPPSTMPGTDYGVNYGSTAYASSDGTVTEIHKGNDGGGGRYVQYTTTDGREIRSIHLSRVDVADGDRLERGQRIGLTGASGYGSDYYYGAHIHQTLWPDRAWQDPEIDFEPYVGAEPAPTPKGEDDDMAMRGARYVRDDGKTEYMLFNEVSGWWVTHTASSGGDYNNPIAKEWDTGSWPTLTEGHARKIQGALDDVRAAAHG